MHSAIYCIVAEHTPGLRPLSGPGVWRSKVQAIPHRPLRPAGRKGSLASVATASSVAHQNASVHGKPAAGLPLLFGVKAAVMAAGAALRGGRDGASLASGGGPAILEAGAVEAEEGGGAAAEEGGGSEEGNGESGIFGTRCPLAHGSRGTVGALHSR